MCWCGLDAGIELEPAVGDEVVIVGVAFGGFGFPRWRGGIMYHADKTGLPNVLQKVEEFYSVHGKLWKPSELLKNLVASGSSFTQD